MPYVLPDLPYDYAALEPHISGQIIELHHDKHHNTYVQGANATIDRLAEARERGDYAAIVGLEKTLAFNVSGHVLHSIYWQNMSPTGGGEPGGTLLDAVQAEFGSVQNLKEHLTSATTTVQGSGWGALAWDPTGQRLLVEQIQDHQTSVVQGSTPLLVIDIWEHAFYLQYRNVKVDYVTAFWNLVDWGDVGRRFDAARAAATAPRT